MSKNPFSQIPTPTKLDPRTIGISDFTKYQSHEMNKFAASLRSYKKSLLYIGGCLAFCAVSAWYSNKLAHQDLFGADNRGGAYLNLKTIYDQDHYAYNREFQRMHVLGEGKLGDRSEHSEKLIKDLGVKVPQNNNQHIPKKAPHERFY